MTSAPTGSRRARSIVPRRGASRITSSTSVRIRNALRARTDRERGSVVVVHPPDDAIALACGGGQTMRIPDHDAAARIRDRAAPLEIAGGHRDADAPHAEHLRQRFLCQLELV